MRKIVSFCIGVGAGEVLLPVGPLLDELPVPRHQGHEPGELLVVDERLQRLVEPFQPLDGKAHRVGACLGQGRALARGVRPGHQEQPKRENRKGTASGPSHGDERYHRLWPAFPRSPGSRLVAG